MIFLARGIPINKAREFGGIPINKAREFGGEIFNAVLMVAKGFRSSVSFNEHTPF